MNATTLAAAIDETNRFLKHARALYSKMKHDEKVEFHDLIVGPKDTGQVRRSSMDLTRRLAEMRKPG